MDTMNLKPKYQIGQKLIYIQSSIYYGELDYISCFPVIIKAIVIYEDCIRYIPVKSNEEIDESELVPYDSNIIGEHIINEIERNIDKCKQ